MRKKKKKGAFGWFQTMTPGNPEYNAKMFNHLMGQGDMPTEADMNANIMGGEAVGEGLNEAQNINKISLIMKKFNADYKNTKPEVKIRTKDGEFICDRYRYRFDPYNIDIDRSSVISEFKNNGLQVYVDIINSPNSHYSYYSYIDVYVPKNQLTEAQKQNEYQITWLDFKDRKYFSHVKAYSEKQAAYMFRKNKGKGVVAKILSIDCIDDHSKDDGEQLSIFGEQMKFKVKKDLLESGTVSRRKEEFIDLWNSKFGRSEFEINSSEIQQHHIDRDTTNNPRDFSNCAYLYSKNPDHLRKAHNYIHAKNLVYNYNLNDVYILSPKGQIIKATKENLDMYALKLPNGFETSDNIAEDQ